MGSHKLKMVHTRAPSNAWWLVLLGTGTVSAQGVSYCQITPKHSLCLNTSPSSFCGKVYSRGLTQKEKQDALDEHNRLRSQVATGRGRGQPPAADMIELQWDDELARVAQARADSCEFGHECLDCRRVSRFKVGQNIFRARDNRLEPAEWRYVIRSFFSEIDLFPGSGSIASFKYTPGTGHYTQMMWSRVTRVGCGLITYYNTDTAPLIARYYVCDYGPSGNKVGERMYLPGSTCSSCPRGTSCGINYPGLCSGTGSFFIDNNSVDQNFQSRSGIAAQNSSSPSNSFNFSNVNNRQPTVLNNFDERFRNKNINDNARRLIDNQPPSQPFRRRTFSAPRRIQPLRRQSPTCDFLCSIARLFRF